MLAVVVSTAIKKHERAQRTKINAIQIKQYERNWIVEMDGGFVSKARVREGAWATDYVKKRKDYSNIRLLNYETVWTVEFALFMWKWNEME